MYRGYCYPHMDLSSLQKQLDLEWLVSKRGSSLLDVRLRFSSEAFAGDSAAVSGMLRQLMPTDARVEHRVKEEVKTRIVGLQVRNVSDGDVSCLGVLCSVWLWGVFSKRTVHSWASVGYYINSCKIRTWLLIVGSLGPLSLYEVVLNSCERAVR